MMLLLSNWRLLGVAVLVCALGVQQIRLSAAQSEISDLRLTIAESVAESQRVAREAIAAAAARERAERERLQAEADAAVIASRTEANAARKRFTDLQRRLEDSAHADPTVDAWRTTAVPGPVRGLLSEGDSEAGAGGGGPR